MCPHTARKDQLRGAHEIQLIREAKLKTMILMMKLRYNYLDNSVDNGHSNKSNAIKTIIIVILVLIFRNILLII